MRIKKAVPIIIFLFSITTLTIKAQKITIKNNTLYSTIIFTPNLGMEIGMGKKTSFNIHTSYNPWNLSGKSANNRKLVHWVIQPEVRYWLNENFDGHYVGVHGLFSKYNIGRKNVNILFGKDSKNHRFEGAANGFGATYGYQWSFGKRWALEANLGLGLIFLNYDKYDARKCGKWIDADKKTYLGPTKIGLNIIYRLN